MLSSIKETIKPYLWGYPKHTTVLKNNVLVFTSILSRDEQNEATNFN